MSLGGLDETLDGRRLLVAGDGADGDLATVLCLTLRDSGAPSLAAQISLYPLLSAAPPPLRIGCAGAPLSGLSDAQACLDTCLSLAALHRRPLALLLKAADFTGLLSASAAAAKLDPLRDDGERYSATLRMVSDRVGLYLGNGLVRDRLCDHSIDEVETLYEVLRRVAQGFLAEDPDGCRAGG